MNLLIFKTVFTILDEKYDYWQIKLDQHICTVDTPYGREETAFDICCLESRLQVRSFSRRMRRYLVIFKELKL